MPNKYINATQSAIAIYSYCSVNDKILLSCSGAMIGRHPTQTKAMEACLETISHAITTFFDVMGEELSHRANPCTCQGDRAAETKGDHRSSNSRTYVGNTNTRARTNMPPQDSASDAIAAMDELRARHIPFHGETICRTCGTVISGGNHAPSAWDRHMKSERHAAMEEWTAGGLMGLDRYNRANGTTFIFCDGCHRPCENGSKHMAGRRHKGEVRSHVKSEHTNKLMSYCSPVRWRRERREAGAVQRCAPITPRWRWIPAHQRSCDRTPG